MCRLYQAAAKKVNPDLNDEDMDWIGIYTTRMNARFMQRILKSLSSPNVIYDPKKVQDDGSSVILGAGGDPGWSSDYDAVEIAHSVGADTLINLSTAGAVYSEDPKTNPNAKKLKKLTWNEYLDIIFYSSESFIPFCCIAKNRCIGSTAGMTGYTKLFIN